MSEKKSKHKHGIKHTHIEHHHDSSHTVKHIMEDGSEHEGSGAVADLPGLHDKLDQNLGSAAPAAPVAEAAAPPPSMPAGA